MDNEGSLMEVEVQRGDLFLFVKDTMELGPEGAIRKFQKEGKPINIIKPS